MKPRELTADEAAAIAAFAAEYGRTWKSKLADIYWYNARLWEGRSDLHALRNDPRWGFAGLRAYRLNKTKE
jgi:hypothetical protein